MNKFTEYLASNIEVESKNYREHHCTNETPEFLCGFNTGYMFALYEIRNNYMEWLQDEEI